MDKQFVPIGSVIEVETIQMMIVGYTIMREVNRPVLGYSVVPHPKGYMSDRDVHFINGSNMKILRLGYTSGGSDFFVKMHENFLKNFEGMSQENIDEFWKIIVKKG